MKNKLKLIADYINIILMSILLFCFCMLLLLKFTILNKSYLSNKFIEHNYIEYIFNDIKQEMTYYTNQSGFNDDIIDDTFTKDEIKSDLYIIIDNMYGAKTNIDTTNFETKLKEKINSFLATMDFKAVNQDEIDKFVLEMAKIYKNKLSFMGIPTKVGSLVHKINKLASLLVVLLPVMLLVILLLNRFFFKNKRNSIVLFVNMFLMFGVYIYIKSSIDIAHIFVYDEGMTKIFVDVLNVILKGILYCGFASFIGGFVVNMVKKQKKV